VESTTKGTNLEGMDKISVSELAQSLGYTSESAFSHAFKRVTGMAPRHYRISVEDLSPM
jgi:AraC-like DNA-binding protein